MNGQDMSPEAMDEILRLVAEEIEREESGLSVMDPRRMEELYESFEALKQLLKGSGARIECVPHDGFASVGTVSVTARNLRVTDPQLFLKAVSRASNWEIYPRTDGFFVLSLTFYGMTHRIGG